MRSAGRAGAGWHGRRLAGRPSAVGRRGAMRGTQARDAAGARELAKAVHLVHPACFSTQYCF